MDPSSWNLLRHLWRFNTNMTIVCSFRTFGVSGSTLHPSDDTQRPWTDSSNEEICLDTELKFSFTDSDPRIRRRRLFLVELETLNESATLYLTLHLLQEQGAMLHGDEKSLSVMYSLCGGNPFYAVELTNAAIRIIRENEKKEKISSISSQIWSKTFLKVASKSRPERIEEIIIYRFDQLSSKSQLLLRVAAVAGYNSAPFNAKMLTFVLPEFSGARTQGELFSSNGGCIYELLKEALERDSDNDSVNNTDDNNNNNNDNDKNNDENNLENNNDDDDN